ncbi:MAG: TCR/Tet family MFS transporter [Steroidobacteraceae bacterium]|jgi:DHA1 family tetracycline resistance protein-like MFS transporter|nr:MFS transporter [Gammaproteobacteria bacterium]
MTIDPESKKRVLPIIAMALFIDSMGIGIIIPVAPQLVMQLSGLGLAEAASIAGWLTLTYASMQFLFSPILGNLSDRFGRRPIILASLAALAVDYVLMGWAPTLAWLFLGRLVAGIAGATFATANAVVADVIPAEKRAKYFGLNGAAWGMGFIVGPIIGGLLGAYGSRVPFFAAAIFTAINFLIAFLVLRETLPLDKRREFSLRRANVLGALRSMRVIPGAAILLLVLFMYQIGHDTLPSTFTWMTMAKFDWTEREVGLSLAALGLGTAVVQGGLVGRMSKQFGEYRTALIGLVGGAIGFLGYAYAPTPGWFFASVPLACLIGLTMPSIRAILSRAVPANAQGELQGAIAGIVSFTAILVPWSMTHLFTFATARPDPTPGAPFFAAALALIVGATLLARSRIRLGQ